jgi:hypothetical protein
MQNKNTYEKTLAPHKRGAGGKPPFTQRKAPRGGKGLTT